MILSNAKGLINNQDSGVNMQYRLMHTEAINYPETTGNDVASEWLVVQRFGLCVINTVRMWLLCLDPFMLKQGRFKTEVQHLDY